MVLLLLITPIKRSDVLKSRDGFRERVKERIVESEDANFGVVISSNFTTIWLNLSLD